MRKSYKAIAIIAAATTMAMMAAGCGAKAPETTPEAAPEAAAEVVEESAPAEIANPVKSVSFEEMQKELGFYVNAPADATDVSYSIIEDESGNGIAQVTFTKDGKEFTYRAQSTGEVQTYDMTGMYFEASETWEGEDVQNREATVNIGDGVASMYWLDVVPGINYSLGCNGAIDKEAMVAMANEIFEPMQGEVGSLDTPVLLWIA